MKGKFDVLNIAFFGHENILHNACMYPEYKSFFIELDKITDKFKLFYDEKFSDIVNKLDCDTIYVEFESFEIYGSCIENKNHYSISRINSDIKIEFVYLESMKKFACVSFFGSVSDVNTLLDEFILELSKKDSYKKIECLV